MWKLLNCEQDYFIERVLLIIVLHLQVMFSRSKMSSQDEGDYMEMSGLVYLFSLFFLNKGILLLLISNFMYVMLSTFGYFYFWLVNSLFILCLGLQVGGKLVHNLPLQGSLGRGRYFKTFFPFRFFSINFFLNQ